MAITSIGRRGVRWLRGWLQDRAAAERLLELTGALLAEKVRNRTAIRSLHDVEFRVYSQWGDDGIIQWLIARLPQIPKRFVEFGVEDYTESNTRFLLVHNNWSGLVMDGSPSNIDRLRRRDWFWRYDLAAACKFLTRDNIDGLIAEWDAGKGVGILHVDVDGNDYWLWDSICCTSPAIVIVEYNAVFGAERPVTVPYASDFRRHAAHYSGVYAGASLAALDHLARVKGYVLVGCNSAGNNAYFLRSDLVSDAIRQTTVGEAFVVPKFRESRDRYGQLDYLSFEKRCDAIRGLPVVNVLTGQIEPF